MDLNKKNEVDLVCELGVEYLFLVSLISADTLINEEECIKSRRELDRFNHDLKLSKVSDEKKQELQKFIDDSYKIIERETKYFKNQKQNNNDRELASEDKTGE